MRRFSGSAFSILLFLSLGFAQGSSPALGSIRGGAFTKGTHGEPAVLPSVRIVLHGPITKETESDALGAFAIDGPHPGSYQVEANAPCMYAGLALKVGASESSTVANEMNVVAVINTTSRQLTRLKAVHCAFSRKVHHA